MASPCKKMKLAPKKTASPKTTQESKRTSTPQCSDVITASPSPTISSIRSVRSRLSDVFEAEECNDSEQSSVLALSEAVDVDIVEGKICTISTF